MRLIVFSLLMLVAVSADAQWTIGPKQVLVVRADFSDVPDNRPISEFTNLMAQVRAKYQAASYWQVDLISTISQVYRMPKTGRSYAVADDWSIDTDARAAASRDYDLDTFDRVIIEFPSLSQIEGSKMKWSGYARLGRYVWLNGWWNFKGVSHELGHTFGVCHAATDSSERGDPYDIMGWRKIDQRSDFNPYFKNQMGWLRSDQVTTITESGSYPVQRMDTPAPTTGALALKVGSHWLFLRRNYVDNSALYTGLCVITERTDWNTTLEGVFGVGQTFTDGNVRVTPTELGDGWMLVTISL